MPLNWKGKKGVSPEQAAKGVKANKPAKQTLGMENAPSTQRRTKSGAKPGNQGSKLADEALAKSKASRKKVTMPPPEKAK